MSDGVWAAIIGAVATIFASAIAAYIHLASKRTVSKTASPHTKLIIEPPALMPSVTSQPRVKPTAKRRPDRVQKPEAESLDQLRAWEAAERQVPVWWPTSWSNVEVRIVVEELALGLRCEDKAVGWFRVVGINARLREVLYLEGPNSEGTVLQVGMNRLQVGMNRLNLPPELLLELFHTVRCKREHKRTGNIDYLRGFEYFHRRAVAWHIRLKR